MIEGRTALITGAGNGLGRAIALRLSRGGARVILSGRDESKLQVVASEVGRNAVVATVDVTSPSSVAVLGDVTRSEEISILVNNAAIPGPVSPLWEVDPDDWDEVYAVNVKGVFLMCRTFLPPMIERRGGDIVNIASVSGKRPLARRTPYTSSKTALYGLTATLAHEVGQFGVRVNTLSPGPVTGPRMDRNFRLEADRTGTTPEEAEKEFVSRSAMGRMVSEEEVAEACAAMLSMTGMTGADIDLSAGMIGR